ncbi:MAG: hypothetical protein M1821_007022 [Bathelium mastoideum]|nr:MAG: hypothetical protein M1821_007022 [Bathelium mastoideum]
MVGISRVGKAYFRPHTGQPRIPYYREGLEGLGTVVRKMEPKARSDQSRSTEGQAFERDVHQPLKNRSSRGGRQRDNIPQSSQVDKGPFESWQGRKPVISSMGRVSLWIKYNEGPAACQRIIKFSAHGSYLKLPDDRFIDFHDRGISLVGADGTVLWRKDIAELRLLKDVGESLIAHHQYEMKLQRKAAV